MQTELQVSPAGKPNCDRHFFPCPTTCGPESWKQEECDLTGPATRAQPTLGMLLGKGTQRRSPHPYSLSQGGEQEVHYRLLLWCIESHRFVIQYTASLCTQPTQLIPVLYFSQFSLLHPQFCWLLSTQERQNSWGNSRAVENFWKCFEPTQPEESIQRKTGKGE